MACTIQLVIDCADPHVLADWWAETLGWSVEGSDEDFIRAMIAQGHANDADTRLHNGTLVWRDAAAVEPADGTPGQLRLLFQRVPEPKTVKNRLHIDLRLGDTDRAEFREQLVTRGATVLYEASQGPHTWVTMADPEGNEFCV